MKKIILMILILSIFIQNISANQETHENNLTDIQNQDSIQKGIENIKDDIINIIERQIPKNIYIDNILKINLSENFNSISDTLELENLFYNWNIDGITTEGKSIEKKFDSKGIKNIRLNIIYKDDEKEYILLELDKNILIYDKSIPLIYSDQVDSRELNRYIDDAKREGIHIYEIGPITDSDIEILNFVTSLNNFYNIPGKKTDYSIIWGSRDFIFNILGKINREFTINPESKIRKYNFIAISSYNMNILESYIQNFLTNKHWLEKILISNENVRHIIFNQSSINGLKDSLEKNQYSYIDVNLEGSEIPKFLFISKFINNLTNTGYSINGIYILLIIPFVLTIISFSKHFIGISPIGIVIPTFLTLLFFKLGVILTLGLLLIFLLVNLLISYITNKYNLLYAPKISFFISINIIILILIINILFTYNLIPLDLNDIVYFVIFIIITERFINIIASKDLSEYKEPFINTIIISFISFLILGLNFVKIILLAYPELLIALVPINFLIGRFTGLRVTEYFRFKEVIKNIEE